MSAITCAGLVEVDLGDEQALPGARRDRRVPADDGDAGVGRLLDGGVDLVAGVVGDHDRVDALRDGVGDELDLAGAVGARGRSDELGLRDAELAGRLLGSFVGLVEHGDAGALGQQDAGELTATAAAVPPALRSPCSVCVGGASPSWSVRLRSGGRRGLAPIGRRRARSCRRRRCVVVVAARGGDEHSAPASGERKLGQFHVGSPLLVLVLVVRWVASRADGAGDGAVAVPAGARASGRAPVLETVDARCGRARSR